MDGGDDVVIRLCGRLEVTVAGLRVDHRLPGRQGRLVLAYLACNRGRPVARDELIDLLWPADPPALPDDVLGALLSKLRRALGPGMIDGRRELTLVLPIGAVTDLELAADALQDAEVALAAGQSRFAWERARVACEVARGRFLPGLPEAAAIAERLDDPELCVHAWDACGAVAMVAGDYESAWRWRTRRLELLDRVTDPDVRTIIGETPYASCVATGRFEQAREVALLHDRLTEPLTPHHRMHGVAILAEVEELLGGWDAIRAQETRVTDAVAANAETPCLRNARSLLVCVLAAACLQDDGRARELERAADELGLLGRQVLDAPRLRLALIRGDRTRAEELLAGLLDERGWYARGHGTSLATVTARLDALALLGHRDRVEAEAIRLLAPGTYVEPFALRALAAVRGDRRLTQQAIDRFQRLGLRWHAAQTRELTLT